MAYTLPSKDFMFPHMIEADHTTGSLRVYDLVTGQLFKGFVCAMREGEYIVERRTGENPQYVIHEGNWSVAHIR